jgi:hypothetical protein
MNRKTNQPRFFLLIDSLLILIQGNHNHDMLSVQEKNIAFVNFFLNGNRAKICNCAKKCTDIGKGTAIGIHH